MKHFAVILLASVAAQAQPAGAPPDDLRTVVEDGYRGIWYMNQPTKDEHRYKYSGGFATYPQWHVPFAIYAPAVRKTFFVYGGSAGNVSERGDTLTHMVSYYDHRTGTVPRPVRILLKQTEDAHDNPTISIDVKGFIYVFSAAHGTSRPSYIWRSRRPYDISKWELLAKTNFSYPQPWFIAGENQFLFMHTIYKSGQRTLNFKTSPDARSWTAPTLLAHIEMGDYQITWPHGDKLGTAFDMHPASGRGKGLNYRTNIYYIETADLGKTWRTAAGEPVKLPLTRSANSALVHDYNAENLNVYLKDIAYDGQGRPVIVYLTSKGWEPGPASGPYQWYTARWDGAKWVILPITTSDHNYDHGSMTIDRDGTWRLIAPTDAGPQPYGTGGDMVMWTSKDQGKNWTRAAQLTGGGKYNHTYARKVVNAHPDFAAIWADGSPLEATPSSLYFSTRDGRVYRLPSKMSGWTAKPELVGTRPVQ